MECSAVEFVPAVALISELKAVCKTGWSATRKPLEAMRARTKHTVSVTLAEVLAYANGQDRVFEGGTAESTCAPKRLGVATDIAGAQWNFGAGSFTGDDIGCDIG